MSDMKVGGGSDGAKVQAPKDPEVSQKSKDTEEKQKPSDNADVRAIKDGQSDFKPSESKPVDLTGAPKVKDPQQAMDDVRKAQIESTLRKSQTASQMLDEAKAKGVDYDFVDGPESSYDGEKIHLSREKSNDQLAMELVHETNHALADKNGQTPDPTGQTRDEYVRRMTAEEAAGSTAQSQVRRELQQAGVDTSGMRPDSGDAYDRSHDLALAAGQSAGLPPDQAEAMAKQAGASAVAKAYENGGVKNSADGRTYAAYYGDAYDQVQRGELDPRSIQRPDGESPNAPGDLDKIEDWGSVFGGVGEAIKSWVENPKNNVDPLLKSQLSQLGTVIGSTAAMGTGMTDLAAGIAKMVNEGDFDKGLTLVGKGLFTLGGAAKDISEMLVDSGLLKEGPLAKALGNTPFASLVDLVSAVDYMRDGTTRGKLLGSAAIATGLMSLNPAMGPAANLIRGGVGLLDAVGGVQMLADGIDTTSAQAQQAWAKYKEQAPALREQFLKETYDARGLPRPAPAPRPLPATAPAATATTTTTAPAAPTATPTPVRPTATPTVPR